MEFVREMERKKRRPLPWKPVLLLVLLLMAVFIWGHNLLCLKTIEYEGLTKYAEQEFTELLSPTPLLGNTYVFFLRHKFFPKPDIPFVEDYDVTLLNNTAVHIQVYEKLVVGCVEIMGKYMYFDKDGIVVESQERRIEGVPLIVGLRFDEIVLHEKLHIQKQSLFTKIMDLTKLLLQYGLNADKVFFDSDYDVTLLCGDIKVLLGRQEMYDMQLAALHGILEAAGGKAGTLDMRNYSKDAPDVVLKPSGP